MNIWIDIDDVVVEFLKPLLYYINNKKKCTLCLNDFSTRDFHSHLSIEYEEFINYIFESWVYKNNIICKDFLYTYNQLKDRNNIFFISSRIDFSHLGFNTLEETKKIFSIKNINQPIFFTRNKKELLKTLGIDLFIDDWLHNFLWLGDNIKKVLIKKPWNREKEKNRLIEKWHKIPKNIIEIDNIKEILKITI